MSSGCHRWAATPARAGATRIRGRSRTAPRPSRKGHNGSQAGVRDPDPSIRQAGPVRLATWNVNSIRARLPRLLDWLAATRPDVLCLQETKIPVDAFPAAEVAELEYETAAHGSSQWNGVAILSRV